MIKVFYISNVATGDYFVLEENFDKFNHKAAGYVFNLAASQKCPNTYTFGSMEMLKKDYQRYKMSAEQLEADRKTGKIDDQGNVVSVDFGKR